MSFLKVCGEKIREVIVKVYEKNGKINYLENRVIYN